MIKFMRNLLNIKVILGAIIFGVGVFSIFVWALWSARANGPTRVQATVVMKVIEAPTQTPLMPVMTETPLPTPTSPQQAPPASGDIAIGNYVQVSGTGGDGLRLHDTAGIASKVNYIAIESELFLVESGPIEADGYTWWELQDPYTENAAGWGVANYLMVVQNP